MKSDLLCEDDHDYRLRVETVVSAEKVVMNQQPESFNYSIVSGVIHSPFHQGNLGWLAAR